jgi:phosphoglycolate phosphatase-like HAD superfamily hydrolase
MSQIAVSDAALADADAIFAMAVEHLAQKFSPIRPLDAATIPAGRAAGIAAIDAWAEGAVGNWRAELVRFYEAHAPQALRPDPTLNGLLRSARRAGTTVTIVSPLPRAAVELYLSHLGVRRYAETVLGEEDDAPEPAIRTAEQLASALASFG